MLEILQTEINELQPLRHKVLHEETVKNDLQHHHQQLSAIFKQQLCSFIADELEEQQTKDELFLCKLQANKIIREKQEELQILVLEKNRMMKQCELNQSKLENNKKINAQLQQQNKDLASEKLKIIRQMKQNQVINERVCLQNDELRQNCEQLIQKVSEHTMEGQRSKMQSLIRKTINQNISIITQIVHLSQPLQQKRQHLAQSNLTQEKLKIIKLTQQLQLQNSQNFIIKNQIKCEEIKYFQLSSKSQFLQKDHSLRQSILQNADEQQFQLTQQIQLQKQKRQQLQSKMHQYKTLQRQLQQMYDKLSSNYKVCKSSDLSCIREMSRNSSKFERNINQQKHFLLQRYSIVDNYRKYLSKNN